MVQESGVKEKEREPPTRRTAEQVRVGGFFAPGETNGTGTKWKWGGQGLNLLLRH